LCQCNGQLGNGISGGAGLGGVNNSSGAITGSSPLPCAVSDIVSQHCSLCHGATPQYTAPMSLVSWEDFQKPSVSDPSVPVYQKVLQRIQDPNKPMPQPPNPRLTAEQIATISNWVAGGATKGSEATCGLGTGAGGMDITGGGAGTGAAGMDAVGPDEECFDIVARADADKTHKFAVPSTPDTYIGFNYAPPWGNQQVQGIRAMSKIDNSAVVHHWILYSTPSAVTDGTNQNDSGSHPGGQFIVGWAPGAPDMMMPDDVGLQLPGAGYQLEIHYNAKSAGQLDGSGVTLCVTHTPRKNVAATHPLGQELFSTFGAGDVTGTCVPRGPFPITIMSMGPHMHLKGIHMKTVVKRANGTTETPLDAPFDFQTQVSYPTPITINQGDSLVTTCTYNGAAQFGTKTTQEMCYNFVVAYPAGALAGAPGYTGVSGNGNTCIK
jgi:cytochrome c551/c552